MLGVLDGLHPELCYRNVSRHVTPPCGVVAATDSGFLVAVTQTHFWDLEISGKLCVVVVTVTTGG